MADEKRKPAGKAAKKTAPKAPSAKKATADKAVTKKAAPKASVAPRAAAAQPVSAAERTRMIGEAAFYKAERRNFAPGHEAEDWAESEREIDAMLRREGRL